MDLDLLRWAAPVLISAASLTVAIISLRRARRADARSVRADERAERAERLDRVRFDLRRSEVQPDLYRLFNVGDEAVADVTVETASVLAVTFVGQRTARVLNPTECMTFTLTSPHPEARVPVSLRVKWAGPFEGERWVLLPEDPTAPWIGVIWSEKGTS